MAFKDQVSTLVLKAKNLLSPGTDDAADSVDNLSDSADALNDKLRALEDQGRLVKQFSQAEKAVKRTSKAWDTAKIRVTKLQEQIEKSGKATASQAAALELASKTAAKAEKEYRKSEKVLEELGDEAKEAGIDLEDLNKAQRNNQKETIAARRALQDYSKEVEKGDSRLTRFRRSLSAGAVSFLKWGAAAAAAGAALTVTALGRFTAGQADLARQTLATSNALGISTDALQEWQYAAASVGIEGDKTADILKDVSEKIGDAFLTGGGEAAEVIAGLGLEIEKLVRLSPDEQLAAIGAELNKLGDRSNKIFVLEALASDASLLLPLLENNTAKLKELTAAAHERGVLISEEDLQALAETNKAFKKIGDRLTEFKNKLAAELSPTFKKLAEDFDAFFADSPELIEDLVAAFGGLIKTTKAWVTNLLDNKDEINSAFRSIGNTASFLGNGFVALFRGTQAFAAGTLEVLTRIGYSASSLYETVVSGLNKIGLASDDAVSAAKERVLNLGAAVQDLEAKADGYKTKMIEAGEAAIHSFDNTGESAKSAGELLRDAARAARDMAASNEGIASTAEAAGEATDYLKRNQDELSREILKTADAIEAANIQWSQDPSAENLARLEALKQKYQELQQVMAGLNPNPSGTDKPGDSSLVDQFRKMAGAADEVTDATGRSLQQVVVLGEEVGKTGDQFDKAGQDAKTSAGNVGAAIGAIGAGWANYINNLSQKAGAAFKEQLGFKQAAADAGVLEGKLATVNARLQDMDARITNGGSISSLLRTWARAGFETEKAFLEQAIAVEHLTDKILEGDRSLGILRKSTEQVGRQFSLLDEQQLAPLIGAIRSAQREIESLNDSLLNTISSTKQELASLRGDSAELERLRYQERQNELQVQLNTARGLGDKEAISNAQEALALTEEAYQLRLKDARQRSDDEKKRALEYETRQADQRIRDEQEERQDVSRTERRTQAQTTQISRAASQQVVTLNLQANGQSIGRLSNLDPDEVALLLQSIEQSGYLTTG